MMGQYENQKDQELSIAINALRVLFTALLEDSSHVMVGRLSEKEVITVMIRGGCYEINVECENAKQMVKSVVDAVILKL